MLKEQAEMYAGEKNCNCAESTLLAAGDVYDLGLRSGDAALMGGFGGGLASGLACGALCGSLAALGKMLLHGPAHEMPEFRGLCAEYVNAFREAMGGTDCREIRSLYFEPGKGCVKAIAKNAELLERFIASHGLKKTEGQAE